jgi:hypothetical protein
VGYLASIAQFSGSSHADHVAAKVNDVQQLAADWAELRSATA